MSECDSDAPSQLSNHYQEQYAVQCLALLNLSIMDMIPAYASSCLKLEAGTTSIDLFRNDFSLINIACAANFLPVKMHLHYYPAEQFVVVNGCGSRSTRLWVYPWFNQNLNIVLNTSDFNCFDNKLLDLKWNDKYFTWYDSCCILTRGIVFDASNVSWFFLPQ